MNYYKDAEITIRDLHENDVVSMFSWWVDKEINKYDPRPIPQNSKQLVEECIRYSNVFDMEKMNRDIDARKYMYFIIADNEAKPIGFVNFFSIDNQKKQGELGVIIGDKRYWRKGIAYKAVCAVVDYIFNNMNIDRIYIETGEANESAIRLFRKLDFKVCAEYFEEDEFKFIVMELKRTNP